MDEPPIATKRRIDRAFERARRERTADRIVSILHVRLEAPISLEPELARELGALAKVHADLEELSERLSPGRPADHES